MPRLILKCPYLKGSRGAARRGNYLRYIATREGVELTQGEESLPGREGYLRYIAQRPHVQRVGRHGLFSASDKPISLSKAAEELSQHSGNVWTPILSLRREDAARLGYDHWEQWQALLRAHAPEIAEAMKIPFPDFRWYAAFHNEGHHPHVHMVCYSADPSKGYLTKEGLAQMRSVLARDIFRQDLTEIYKRQTQRREDLVQESQTALRDAIQKMREGPSKSSDLEPLLLQLAQKLRATSGKKRYGYLKSPVKKLVDEIVEELARDPAVSEAYRRWYALREEVLHTYRDDLPERIPLSEQKEFRQIKNLVIQEAANLGDLLQNFDPQGPQSEEPVESLRQKAERGDAKAQYLLGRQLLTNTKSLDQSAEAVRFLTASATQGNQYAQYALGRLYLSGKQIPQDRESAIHWLTLAAKQGNEYARELLEHLEDWQRAAVARGVLRLFRQVAGIFQDRAAGDPNRGTVCGQQAAPETPAEKSRPGAKARRGGSTTGIGRRFPMGGFFYGRYTKEQVERANQVDLEELLLRSGEKLLRSGREKRLASDHSVTIRGNEWYDHAAEEGGFALSFTRKAFGLSFQEAMALLLGENGQAPLPTAKPKPAPEPSKPFALPPRRRKSAACVWLPAGDAADRPRGALRFRAEGPDL